MLTSNEFFGSFAGFRDIFRGEVIYMLSQRDKFNARRSCRFFRQHIPPDLVIVKERILPPLTSYANHLGKGLKVRSLVVGPQVDQTWALVNKALSKDFARHSLMIDERNCKSERDPSVCLLDFKSVKIKLELINIDRKSDYKGLFFSNTDLVYLVCDVGQRECLSDLSHILSEIRSYHASDAFPHVILLVINSQHASKNSIDHLGLKDYITSNRITTWYEVNPENAASIRKSLLAGLQYFLMSQYPTVKEALANKLFRQDPKPAQRGCSIM